MSQVITQNAVNWFELFVHDLDRAKRFYETILQSTLTTAEMEGCRMAIFPYDQEEGIGGALTKMEGMSPGSGGTMIYLNVEGDLDGVLERTWGNGGSVVKPRTSIGDCGFIGIIKDSEGNTVGLHSTV